MSFLVFCEFLLNEKSEVKLFPLKRSALKRGIHRCIIHCHIMFNNPEPTRNLPGVDPEINRS
jgi:hypothetical protein